MSNLIGSNFLVLCSRSQVMPLFFFQNEDWCKMSLFYEKLHHFQKKKMSFDDFLMKIWEKEGARARKKLNQKTRTIVYQVCTCLHIHWYHKVKKKKIKEPSLAELLKEESLVKAVLFCLHVTKRYDKKEIQVCTKFCSKTFWKTFCFFTC